MEFNDLRENISNKLARNFGVSIAEATKEQLFRAIQLTVRDMLAQKRANYNNQVKVQNGKRVYYLCIEFLMGRQMKNNLMNLGINKELEDILSESEFSLDEIYACEADPGLGNGGLGRLAACFIDALTTCDYPATGHSILYE
jgi:starch phosphorylase